MRVLLSAEIVKAPIRKTSKERLLRQLVTKKRDFGQFARCAAHVSSFSQMPDQSSGLHSGYSNREPTGPTRPG